MIETRTGEDVCACCQYFKMKDHPQHAAIGLGRCHGYDNWPNRLDNPFTPWTTKSCNKFVRATDYEARQEWVARQRAKRPQPAAVDEVDNETKG